MYVHKDELARGGGKEIFIVGFPSLYIYWFQAFVQHVEVVDLVQWLITTVLESYKMTECPNPRKNT